MWGGDRSCAGRVANDAGRWTTTTTWGNISDAAYGGSVRSEGRVLMIVTGTRCEVHDVDGQWCEAPLPFPLSHLADSTSVVPFG